MSAGPKIAALIVQTFLLLVTIYTAIAAAGSGSGWLWGLSIFWAFLYSYVSFPALWVRR